MKKRIIGIFAVLLIVIGLTACTKEKAETVKVPDLVNVYYSDAKEVLKELKLIPARIYEESDTVGFSSIIRTEPKAGEIVEKYTKVTIFVSD